MAAVSLRRGFGRRLLCALVAVGAAALGGAPAAGAGSFAFAPAVKLGASDGGTEPRVAVGAGNHSWLISNSGGTAVVYGSTDGMHWNHTATDPGGQSIPSIDVDVVTTATGRIVATELDFKGPAIITSYSDDGGSTWTQSSSFALTQLNGTELLDQDRPWLASGPADPTTHLPRVYLLFHNLASGSASHNMYVMTSTDNGATFGPPIPTTLPGSQAWSDLQCADSGGPSDLVVNQKTGQVYAVWGTRSGPALGGCAASITGPFEVNVVAATRVWVSTAPAAGTADPTAWTQSLVVDDNAANHIVGMQLAPGALDSAGNLYVFYPESPNAYPDYDGAALRYKHAPPDLSSWSAPVTVATGGGAGNLLPHVVAGDPGKLDFAYFAGVAQPGSQAPLWYATAAQTLNGLDANPVITTVRLSDIPTYQWTASQMMGACGTGPTAGVQNGLVCSRSTDVWGLALDNQCRAEVTWPVQGANTGGSPPNATATQGTYEATQLDGSPACATAAAVTTTPSPTTTGTTTPNTAAGHLAAGPWLPLLLLALAATLGLGGRFARRRGWRTPTG